LPPSGLTAHDISRFLDGLKLANSLAPVKIPKESSGSLDIFTTNTAATTEAYALVSGQTIADVWRKVLPSPEVITLELNENDKRFVGEIAFQYTALNNTPRTAARHIRFEYGQRGLSGVLAKWHRNLTKERPPVEEVIFLCERFRVFDGDSHERKREFDQLKVKYQNREAV